jgi:hypothetical protein
MRVRVDALRRKGRMLGPATALVAAVVVLNAIIWLLLPSPPAWGCGDEPPGQAAKLHDFRTPSYILIAVVGAAVTAWLLWSSMRSRGERPGTPTIVAAALPALLGFVSLLSPAARDLWIVPGLAGFVAIAVGLPLLGIWGVVLLLGRPRPRGSLWHARTTAWLVLYLALPATGLAVWLTGSDFNLGC